MITRTNKTLTGESGAVFSDCEHYRYRLWREFDSRLPSLCFLMLNPSTADEQANDATITRCEARAVGMKYCQLDVVNLFPWRATDPDKLLAAPDPIGTQSVRSSGYAQARVATSRLVSDLPNAA